ncbi:hypothetical protein BCON_0155g00060 [Botryotinia convoluta]|uniref:Uncharacterized protein n=1 Tax=Botryotinia convoluta TaxID=54673 RepID=A0A4Z1I408_9HELO|nr:hypothetical protein BCON_0155g00060 [Botryotinia convoluta]
MFHSSKSSKVTLHKKLFAPVSITSALGSGSSTEPKATIPVLLPAEPVLETEVQAEVQIQTQEQDIVSVSSNPVSSTTKSDSALPPAAVPTPVPNTHSTIDTVELQDTETENKVVANSIQVLPPSPPRSPFYPSSSSHQSSHQSSTHRRNMSSTSATTTKFGSPPPSYTPFVTNSLPSQAYPYHVQNRYGHTNGYRHPNGNVYSNGFPAGNQYVNAPLNHQVIHRTGFASPSPSPSPGLQLPDLVDEVLRLRDRLNLLEGGALALPGERGSRERGRGKGRRGDIEIDEERKNKKAKEIERETREAIERWEEIEKCGLGYEDFLDEFFGNDYNDWKIEKFEFEEEGEVEGGLNLKLESGRGMEFVDEVCDVEEKGRDEYEDEDDEEEEGKEDEEEETESEEDEDEESESEEESSEEQSAEEEKTPKPEDTITLLPSVFVDERTKSRFHPPYSSSSSTFSSYFPRSSAPSTPPYNQQKFQEIPLKSTPAVPDPPRIVQRQHPDPSLPGFGCHYFVDAGSIQNITVIYPVTSLPQSMDDLKEEKEVVRCVLEGWNKGIIDKYGHRPSKRAYAAIIYPDPQAPLPRKKLRIALSFTPIYPPTSSSTSPIPTTQTPTNPEDITTDTSIYISTTNGCTSFSLSNNNGVMDYTKYKVKYSNQDVHERHDGILEVGRLRGALGCEVFEKQDHDRGKGKGGEEVEGDGTENKIGDEEEQWENEVVKDKWKDDNHGVGWGDGDDKKGYALKDEKEMEGGWI